MMPSSQINSALPRNGSEPHPSTNLAPPRSKSPQTVSSNGVAVEGDSLFSLHGSRQPSPAAGKVHQPPSAHDEDGESLPGFTKKSLVIVMVVDAFVLDHTCHQSLCLRILLIHLQFYINEYLVILGNIIVNLANLSYVGLVKPLDVKSLISCRDMTNITFSPSLEI